MTAALPLAIERRNWTLAALVLLLGVADAASRLPPETLESLLELLEVPHVAVKRTKTRRPAKRSTKKLAHDFYGSALDSAERIELEEAAELEGLDDEIAVLRVKLRKAMTEQPEDRQLMMRGIELLVKAVSARYRLSKKAQADLADSIDGVIRSVGGALMPEAFDDD